MPDPVSLTLKTSSNSSSIIDQNIDQNTRRGNKRHTTKSGDRHHVGLKAGKGLSVLVEKLLIDSGIAEYHEAQDEISGNSKIGNLQELLNAATDYQCSREGLLNFLENIELDRASIEEKSDNILNPVTLITFHNTKGLEFKRVIMTGLEQGIFPREEKKGDELEEERRLFYVGATRAMDELYFTTCRERMMYGRTKPMEPSIFLHEIDKSCLSSATRSATPGAARGVAGKFSSGWNRGQRVFHDDLGYGAVVSINDSEDGPVVHVRFDNGQSRRFLSEIQGRAYEKVKEDY